MSSFANILGDGLVDASGAKFQTKSELEGKHVMIYFSAHWYLLAIAWPSRSPSVQVPSLQEVYACFDRDV
jgi:hypothetical protein